MPKNITLKAKIETNANEAARAMKAFAGVVATADHGLRLAEKGARVLAAGFAETIGQSLKFRDAQDGSKQKVEELNKSLLLAKVAVGDALMPAFVTLATSATAASDAFREWLNSGEAIKRQDLVTWAAESGRAMVSFVATGALLATEAYNGLRQAISATKLAGFDALEAILGPAAAGSAAAASQEKALRDMNAALEDQARIRAGLDRLVEASGVAIAAGEKAGIEAAKQSTDARRVQTEAEKKAIEARKKAAAEYAAFEAKAHQEGMARDAESRRATLEAIKLIDEKQRAEDEANRKRMTYVGEDQARRAREMTEDQRAAALQQTYTQQAIDKTKEQDDANASLADSAASSAYGTIRGLVGIATSAENAGEAVKGIALALLEIVAQQAAVALLSTLFGALTGGAGGGLFGFLFGNTGTTVPRFAMGGNAPSGFGWDSVPAMLTPGEVVVSAPAVRQAQSGIAPRGLAPASSPGNVTFNVSLNSSLPSTPAQTEDQLHRTIGPFLARHYGLRRR